LKIKKNGGCKFHVVNLDLLVTSRTALPDLINQMFEISPGLKLHQVNFGKGVTPETGVQKLRGAIHYCGCICVDSALHLPLHMHRF